MRRSIVVVCVCAGLACSSSTAAETAAPTTVPDLYKKFASNLTITVSGNVVVISSTGMPDHKSPDGFPVYAPMENGQLVTSSSLDAAHGHSAPTADFPHGAMVTERSLEGRVTVAHFFHTRCSDICPVTSTHLERLLDTVHSEARLQVLSYSVRADNDAVTDLVAFADARGMHDARWHLLTGNRASIDSLARHSFFVRLGDGAPFGVKTIAHTESVLLVDGHGRSRGVYAATLPLEMQRLREDVRVLRRS